MSHHKTSSSIFLYICSCGMGNGGCGICWSLLPNWSCWNFLNKWSAPFNPFGTLESKRIYVGIWLELQTSRKMVCHSPFLIPYISDGCLRFGWLHVTFSCYSCLIDQAHLKNSIQMPIQKRATCEYVSVQTGPEIGFSRWEKAGNRLSWAAINHFTNPLLQFGVNVWQWKNFMA